MKFALAYLTGQATEEDIHAYIDQWHDSTGTEQLYEFLGLSWTEYSHWVLTGELFHPDCYRDLRGEPVDGSN